MYEGKHIHYSPVDNRPLCSYSGKLCRQRRVNGYAFCIRHILEDKTAPFKQCAHVAKYNNQKCTNPIPSNEDREFCNSHMQVAGMAPKKERKNKKDKDSGVLNANDGKLKFSDRVKVLLKSEGDASPENFDSADDPYTFSDATLELADVKRPPSEVAAVVKSPDTTVPEPVVETLVKLEAPKTNCALDKGKGNPVRSSKSVNRLEAKITQNKILDKLKKSRPSGAGNPCTRLEFDVAPAVDQCHSEIDCSANLSQCMEPASLQSSCTNNNIISASGRTRTDCHHSSILCSKPVECDVLNSRTVFTYNVMPNKQTQAWTWRKPEIVSSAVNQLQRICEDKNDLVANLFPLGLEGTDSDNEDSDQETYQKHWFASPGDQELWPEEQHGVLLRPMKLNLGKAELRRQCLQLRRAQIALMPSRQAECSLAQALVTACRKQPLRATRLLSALQKDCCQQGAKKRTSISQNKQKCCYSNEDTECSKTALPYTRHCVKHIMYNVDQLLFEHCTAKFADNTQCCIPVFDICHELPLCVEHARKRDNYSKMSAEPKPKKPRKKTKPSALTRPPKRGKKKRRQTSIRLPELNTPSQSSTSQEMPSSLHYDLSSSGMSPQTSPLDTDDVTNELGGPMESGLGSELDGPLSPGTIDKSLDLPIDAAELANQASRLLEEHDFTEVLNKIPDEAFRELFNESKNGDLSPSKEEAEELERALAAVDKDVKSLEKFSSTEQLDIHDSLLQNDHLGATIDSTLSELTASGIGIDNLNVITSSLTTSDLNSISQVLSSITSEGSLAHLPILSDIVNSSGHHSTDMVAGGFAVGSHPLLTGRSDLGNVDHYVCDPADTSVPHAYWLNEQLSIPTSHNGLFSPHNYGHTPSSKFVPHSLTNISKFETKGRNHVNNLSATLLENSLNLSTIAPMVMELTENSTESVS